MGEMKEEEEEILPSAECIDTYYMRGDIEVLRFVADSTFMLSSYRISFSQGHFPNKR